MIARPRPRTRWPPRRDVRGLRPAFYAEKDVCNPAIAMAMRRIAMCEQAGTDMRMMREEWQRLGHPTPTYKNDRAWKAFEWLVEPGRALRAVRFRSGKRMRNREQILVDVGRWLGDFGDLEGILDDRVHHDVDQIRGRLRARKDRGDAAAALAREAFGLDAQEPVRDICGIIESGGIKVGELKVASHDFFGLSVAPAEGGPAVIVNTWDRIPVERWIFNAAHELGHLILHLSDYDISRTDEEKKHEEEANAFAAAFLMPNTSFRKEWDATYGLAFVDRIMKVKRIFRVSYRTVLYRLAPDLHGPGNIWVRFHLGYGRRHGRALLSTRLCGPLVPTLVVVAGPQRIRHRGLLPAPRLIPRGMFSRANI